MPKQITRSVIVKAEPEKAFQVWSSFENFPLFMKHIKQVESVDEKTSHWEVEGPMGQTAKWNAEITRFEPNKRIGWSTKDRSGGNVTTSGQVTFNELPQGKTEVTVIFQFEPTSGIAGDIITALFAKPETKLEEDLRNYKAYVEGRYDRTNP